ncbi:MAG TPA: L,D-transpeptidase [Burkholderiaceae bacterium]
MNRIALALLAAGLAVTLSAQSGPAMAAPAKTAKAAAWSADAVNATDKLKPAGPKSSGAHVLRAQILLDRAHFSSGEIDGSYGTNMQRAVTGYQRKMGLPETGKVDDATWQSLNADSAQALITYTMVDADVAGPYTKIPAEMADKAALPALDFESPEEALAERFHMSVGLLKKLNPGKDVSVAGTELLVPNVLDTEPLPKAGRIVVDKSDSTLSVYDTAGVLVAQFPASTGSEKDPLPIGKWKVNGVSKNPKFHYNPKLFWDASPGDKKAMIPPGPNNPVGVAWVDLSKDHYGIHGTPVPATIGKTQSHGCIRLTNWDVMLLTTSVGPGTEVLLEA